MAIRIFISATEQHVGKTSMTLGLVGELLRQGVNVGYCKPVGQQYLEVDGQKADKDAVVLMSILGMKLDARLHSPVIITQGYTRSYIENPCPEKIEQRIRQAADALCERHDVVVFEGTGHPGVGAVVDHSNAQVARLLDARVILVGEAGIGNCIDRLILAKAIFDQHGVPVIGTIINKMRMSKFNRIAPPLRQVCLRNGLPVLGMIPYEDTLVYPRLDQILKNVEGTVVVSSGLNKRIGCYSVGSEFTMQHASLDEELLVVAPREHLALIIDNLVRKKIEQAAQWTIGGVLITEGMPRDKEQLAIFEVSKTPVIATSLDTYRAVKRLNSYVAKIDRDSHEKIDRVMELFRKYVDTDALVKQVDG